MGQGPRKDPQRGERTALRDSNFGEGMFLRQRLRLHRRHFEVSIWLNKIGIKENLSISCSRFVDVPAKKDGQLVAAVKEMGAVPFCLTNIPQTMKVRCIRLQV